jgi:hypothetical protein
VPKFLNSLLLPDLDYVLKAAQRTAEECGSTRPRFGDAMPKTAKHIISRNGVKTVHKGTYFFSSLTVACANTGDSGC